MYNNKEQGKIERLLKKWYEDRKVYKKLKDPREYCLKICLNTCFSGDTSVLTSTGIKNIKDCNIGDMVYSLNRTTGETELKPIIATQQLPYDGKMIHFKKRNIDLIVTPDHNMVYEHNKKISLISAENMLQKTYEGHKNKEI